MIKYTGVQGKAPKNISEASGWKSKDNLQIHSLAHTLGELDSGSPSVNNGCICHQLLVDNGHEMVWDAVPPLLSLLLERHRHLLLHVEIGGHGRRV